MVPKRRVMQIRGAGDAVLHVGCAQRDDLVVLADEEVHGDSGEDDDGQESNDGEC